MNILLISNKVPYPANDGGTIATLNMAKGFAGLGFNVTILTMATLKHAVSLEEIPASLQEKIQFRIVNVPAPITPFGALKNLLFSSLPYNAERFIDRNFSKELVRLLKSQSFDIVQLEGLFVCPYIKIIRDNSDSKIIYRAHNIEFEIWERRVKMAVGLKKWYLGLITRRMKEFEIGFLNAYDLLVPITPRDAEILDNLGNRKPWHVSQTGIDSLVLVPEQSETEFPSLFHIGALDWAPNQEGIIWFLENCWVDLSEKFPGLKFYIAGRNAPPWLEKKLQVPGVVYLGEIEDAYKFMNSKAVMLVPLFAGSGMRIKIIEGMALGKTIVSTSVGAEGIDITPGENIWIANTPDEFIGTISNLIENKPLFEKTGFKAIYYIQENFENSAIAGRLAAFYKNELGWD